MVSISAPPHEHGAISNGDVVCTADGHRLGEVVAASDDTLVVENGLFFRRQYTLGHHEIDRCEHGVLITSLTLTDAKAREQRSSFTAL